MGSRASALVFFVGAFALMYVVLAAVAIGVVVALVVFIRGNDKQARTKKTPRKPRR